MKKFQVAWKNGHEMTMDEVTLAVKANSVIRRFNGYNEIGDGLYVFRIQAFVEFLMKMSKVFSMAEMVDAFERIPE